MATVADLEVQCRGWKPGDLSTFPAMIALAIEVSTGFRRMLASVFEVPETWIDLWASGGARPSPGTQKHVVALLLEEMRLGDQGMPRY